MVENPLLNAGDTGSIPVQGTKIPHIKKQLSLQATRRGARTQQVAPVLQPETLPHITTRESPCTTMKSSHTTTKIQNRKKKKKERSQ